MGGNGTHIANHVFIIKKNKIMYYFRSEVERQDNKETIKLFCPGCKKEKFEVGLQDNLLTVHYPELFTKNFSINNHKSVNAYYKDGVLSVEVTRSDKNHIEVL